MINFTKEACGQGGEVNFQKYLKWNNNNYFEIVDRRRFEMKKLENYASGNDAHKIYFALDSLQYLDFFWACEDGLWRCHPGSQIASFVFQDMKYQRDNEVSIMITISIRSHISKDAPKNGKDVFSSKSLRIASSTEMEAHQGVNLFESHDHSCHIIFTNKESYLDRNTLALTLSGAYDF